MTPLDTLPIPLLEWYAEHKRDLPWRSDPTAYHVWLSEIMLQQTRVAAVLDYYRRFVDAVPSPAHLAALPEDQLMKLWQGLGYYSRARNLQKAARQIMNEFGGRFPDSYEDIRSLAGVGDYTAGAISSIAFGIPVPAVDGNVLRVVTRLTADPGDVTQAATKKRITQALAGVMPVHAPGDFNQALMELGATVCLPNGAPLCDQCPAAPFCQAHLSDTAMHYPVKPPKKERRVEQRTVFLIFHDRQVALRRRPDKGLLAGLWEYPNELSPAANALAGWNIVPDDEYNGGTGKHIFSHIEWHMTARIVRTRQEGLPQGWVWCGREELERQYALPSAFAAFEDRVRAALGYFD